MSEFELLHNFGPSINTKYCISQYRIWSILLEKLIGITAKNESNWSLKYLSNIAQQLIWSWIKSASYLTISCKTPRRPIHSCLSRIRIIEVGLKFLNRTDLVSYARMWNIMSVSSWNCRNIQTIYLITFVLHSYI